MDSGRNEAGRDHVAVLAGHGRHTLALWTFEVTKGHGPMEQCRGQMRLCEAAADDDDDDDDDWCLMLFSALMLLVELL